MPACRQIGRVARCARDVDTTGGGRVTDVRRLLGALAACAAVAVALAGCAGGGAGAGGTTPATTGPDLTLSGDDGPGQARAAEEAAVLRSYEGMWANIIAVGAAPDADSPLLAEFAAGRQLARNRRWMADFARRGVVLKGTVQTHPHVVALTSGERAVIEACVDGSQWVEVDAAAGKVEPDPPSPPDLNVATLEPVGGTWKVTELTVVVDRC
jgi:hypothetical protein